MRKLFRFISVTALLITLTLVEAKAQSITYTTQSMQARELAQMGTKHVANAEIELAYTDFKEALKLDPGFTYAQLFLANLSVGDTKKMYQEQARSSVKNKSEGEKMMISTLKV